MVQFIAHIIIRLFFVYDQHVTYRIAGGQFSTLPTAKSYEVIFPMV